MERTFASTLSSLRRSNGLSQRKVASDLNISQALLSHYENGAREPGLSFVCRVCDYYHVSADYLLCRTDNTIARSTSAEIVRSLITEMKNVTNNAEKALEEIG